MVLERIKRNESVNRAKVFEKYWKPIAQADSWMNINAHLVLACYLT